MSAKQEEPQRAEQRHDDRETAKRAREAGLLEAVLRDNLLVDLGRPADLLRVQVVSLWGDHYRVNVFVGDTPADAKVAHSYFVEANGNGKILHSTPAIAKVY